MDQSGITELYWINISNSACRRSFLLF